MRVTSDKDSCGEKGFAVVSADSWFLIGGFAADCSCSISVPRVNRLALCLWILVAGQETVGRSRFSHMTGYELR